jgi:hypothetical protein
MLRANAAGDALRRSRPAGDEPCGIRQQQALKA